MKKLLLSALLTVICLPLFAEVLHTEKSLYRNIIVDQKSSIRCMIFGRYSQHPDHQSCIDLNQPERLVFSYTKLVMSGLLIESHPKKILILGLGGGTLPLTLEAFYPDSKIETVEIDQSVVEVAKKWFFYKESPQQTVHISDARVYVKRKLLTKQKYDLIILDAFNGDYIPEHLMTLEFLTEVKNLMTQKGLLIANTFSQNKLYHNESMTYQNVYGKFHYLHSTISGNRLIYAQKTYSELDNDIRKNKELLRRLMKIGVDIEYFDDHLTSEPDWRGNAKPLSDQYSPANLLNQ